MKLTHPHDALRRILAAVRPLPARPVALEEALGCCLGEDVRADRDQPPTDRAAVDGYALRTGDLAHPTALRLVGESAAGRPSDIAVSAGTCVRVLTGAVVPLGADAVVMVEHTRRRDGRVRCLTPPDAGANIRRRGEETRRGEVVLPRGALLLAPQIGMCAAVGAAVVNARPRPRAAIISTGHELRGLDEPVGDAQIRDSNGPTIRAALALAGFEGDVRTVGDDPEDLAGVIAQAVAAYDAVLLSGGVSVGRYDFVPRAIRSLGGRVHIHGVSIKPGKPLLYARLKRRDVFALPGNPVSALVALHQFALPALRRLAGFDPPWCRPALHLPLASAVHVKGPRVQYRLCRILSHGDTWTASVLDGAGSADLASACGADGMVELLPDRTRFEAGDVVPFIPWRPI